MRELGAEFARKFPKVAGRLGITELACDDPHVERLMQGFAFLSAGVSQRLDAEFPRFTTELMHSVFPQYLGPTPSMVIAQFAPEFEKLVLTTLMAPWPREAPLSPDDASRAVAAAAR